MYVCNMHVVVTGVYTHSLITSACVCELGTTLKTAYAFKCMAGSQEQVPYRSPRMTVKLMHMPKSEHTFIVMTHFLSTP